MRRALGWVFGLVVIAASTSLLLAKGVTTKITIEAGGLDAPIVISDPAVLNEFNVWAGRGGAGYVYFPDRHDRRYRLNAGSILRGCEGQWFRATDAGQRAFRTALARR